MHKITILLALIGYVTSAGQDNRQYLPPQGNSIQGPRQQQGFPGPKPGPQGGQYQPSGPSYDGHQGISQRPAGSHGPAGPHGPAGAHGPTGTQQQYPQGPGGQPSSQYGAPSEPGGQGPQQYPTQRSPLADVPILRLDSENPGDGTYRYAYETGNDIAAEEEGSAQSGWNKARGSYRFVSPEGQNFEITYTADENGYVPQGAHLPTPPPIPDAILKSLEVIRQAEASGNIIEGAYQPEGDDGQYHESHDEGQYNAQQPGGGYQQPGGGYQQGGADASKAAPHGGQPGHQGGERQRYPGQQSGGQQQPTAPNGGYRY